jgi:hypothetical protein
MAVLLAVIAVAPLVVSRMTSISEGL